MLCEQAGEHGQRGAGVPGRRPYPFTASWLTVRVLLAVPPTHRHAYAGGERGGDGRTRHVTGGGVPSALAGSAGSHSHTRQA
jgi:hypothetical protein